MVGRGSDVEQRDPRDIEIERLQQRIRDLEIQHEISQIRKMIRELELQQEMRKETESRYVIRNEKHPSFDSYPRSFEPIYPDFFRKTNPGSMKTSIFTFDDIERNEGEKGLVEGDGPTVVTGGPVAFMATLSFVPKVQVGLLVEARFTNLNLKGDLIKSPITVGSPINFKWQNKDNIVVAKNAQRKGDEASNGVMEPHANNDTVDFGLYVKNDFFNKIGLVDCGPQDQMGRKDYEGPTTTSLDVFNSLSSKIATTKCVGAKLFERMQDSNLRLRDKPHSFFAPEGKPPRRGLNSRPLACENQNPNLPSPLKNWSTLWSKNKKALNDHPIISTIRRRSFYRKPPPPPPSQPPQNTPKVSQSAVVNQTLKSETLSADFYENDGQDYISTISDDTLLRVLARFEENGEICLNSLVSKKWLNLGGGLVRKVKVCDWEFVKSGRIFLRFPNVVDVDLVKASVVCGDMLRSCGFSLGREFGPFCVGSDVFVGKNDNLLLGVEDVDLGLKELVSMYPNLRRLVVVNCSDIGLLDVAERCVILQELVLHCCNDQVLLAIGAFQNLQILKLVGNVDGFYSSLVSDIGLTILAQGCKRLVKLELRGCEGSYDGIRAIGQCCQMLEELTFCDHRMDDGWLSSVSYCENLKSLRLVSCKRIDGSPGLDEHLGSCRMLERLHMERCQLRDKESLRAVFLVCRYVKEMVIKDCWGLKDGIFLNASLCSVSYCENLKSLRLVSCKRIDGSPGLDEHLGSCRMLERLHMERCQLRDKESLRAVFLVCRYVKEMVIKDCWGLKDGIFLNASLCRRLKFLSLEGCSKLTTEGLESVVLSLKELDNLRVISCKNIKDNEVSPALSTLFTTLKNLKWTPDNITFVSTSLSESGMGKRGGKFFKKLQFEHLKLGI
nr:F-box protein At5g07670-like [Tanacetum cinerariifolium]